MQIGRPREKGCKGNIVLRVVDFHRRAASSADQRSRSILARLDSVRSKHQHARSKIHQHLYTVGGRGVSEKTDAGIRCVPVRGQGSDD